MKISDTPAAATDAENSTGPNGLVAPVDSKPEAEKVSWLAEIRSLGLMLLGVLAFHTFIAKPFYIPSESMLPNLLVGDRLVVSKYPYGWSWVSISFHLWPRADWRIAPATPEYGDVVIVVPPDRAEDYIKRVVALPGDTIALVEGRIILNGTAISRTIEAPVQMPIDENAPCDFGPGFDYRVRLASGNQVCEVPTFRETLPNGASYQIIDHVDQFYDNMAEIQVPEGHVFLMGDNRDHSADGRAPVSALGLGGPVPLTSVGGRAEFTTFSLDGTTTWNPISWFTSMRGDRAFKSLRPAIINNGGSDGKD